MRLGTITRNLDPADKTYFAAAAFKRGEKVWLWDGNTYGVISKQGVPVSRLPGEYPFLEVPQDAVKWED